MKKISMPLNPMTGKFYDGSPVTLSSHDPVTGEVGNNFRVNNFCNTLSARSRRTPDFHELRFMKEIPYFAYGLDQLNGDAHQLLRGARALGKGHTLGNEYLMKENHRQPVVFDTDKESTQKFKIRGEIYGVSVEHIHMLDHYFLNEVGFKRIKRRVLYEDLKPEGSKVYKSMAYDYMHMYLGVTKFWDDKSLTFKRPSMYGKGLFELTQFYEYFNWKPLSNEGEYDEWGYGCVNHSNSNTHYPNPEYGRRGVHCG